MASRLGGELANAFAKMGPKEAILGGGLLGAFAYAVSGPSEMVQALEKGDERKAKASSTALKRRPSWEGKFERHDAPVRHPPLKAPGEAAHWGSTLTRNSCAVRRSLRGVCMRASTGSAPRKAELTLRKNRFTELDAML